MKKLILIFFLFGFISATAQDSTEISVTLQNRDIEYIGAMIFNDNEAENLYDSIKVKYRVQNPPTGVQTVTIVGLTKDFYSVFQRCFNDHTALKSNLVNRFETALRAVNQSYLTGKIDALNTAEQQSFQTMRQLGRLKLRRQ